MHLESGNYRNAATLLLNKGATRRGNSQTNPVLFYHGTEQAIKVGDHFVTIRDLHITTFLPATTSWNVGNNVGCGKAQTGILAQGVELKVLNCSLTCFNDRAKKAEGSRSLKDTGMLVHDYGMTTGRRLVQNLRLMTSGEIEPSVSKCNVLKTANEPRTAMTEFTQGNSGRDWNPRAGDHMTAVCDGQFWYCSSSQNSR